MNEAIVGIGSNIDPEENILRMLDILAEKTEVVSVSSWIKTTPLGLTSQPDFINAAVKIRTSLTIDQLNILLKGIEDRLGRDRSAPKFGPRTMDLDIVAWNGNIVDPDYYTRDFLKKTVDEIW